MGVAGCTQVHARGMGGWWMGEGVCLLRAARGNPTLTLILALALSPWPSPTLLWPRTPTLVLYAPAFFAFFFGGGSTEVASGVGSVTSITSGAALSAGPLDITRRAKV